MSRINWAEMSQRDIVEIIETADRYGDTSLLASARAALKRKREQDGYSWEGATR